MSRPGGCRGRPTPARSWRPASSRGGSNARRRRLTRCRARRLPRRRAALNAEAWSAGSRSWSPDCRRGRRRRCLRRRSITRVRSRNSSTDSRPLPPRRSGSLNGGSSSSGTSTAGPTPRRTRRSRCTPGGTATGSSTPSMNRCDSASSSASISSATRWLVPQPGVPKSRRPHRHLVVPLWPGRRAGRSQTPPPRSRDIRLTAPPASSSGPTFPVRAATTIRRSRSAVDEYTSWVSIFSHHHSLVAAPDGSPAPTEVPTVSANRLAQRTRELAALAELESKLAADHREFSLNAAGEFLPQTAEYVRSAWTWHRQPQPSLEEFCAERGLQPGPLARWLSALGLAEPSHPASSKPWWNQWADARASDKENRIAEAAREIEKVHVADESSPFFDLSADALKWLTLDQQTQLSRLENKSRPGAPEAHQRSPGSRHHRWPRPGRPAPTALTPSPSHCSSAAPLRTGSSDLGPARPLHLARCRRSAARHPPLRPPPLDRLRPPAARHQRTRLVATGPAGRAGRLDALATILTAGDGSLASVPESKSSSPPRQAIRSRSRKRNAATPCSLSRVNSTHASSAHPRPPPTRAAAASTASGPSRAKPSPLLGSFLESQANALVQLAIDSAGPSPATQSLWLTRRLLARPPSAQERLELTDSPDRAGLIAFCLTLFQSDEFRVLR